MNRLIALVAAALLFVIFPAMSQVSWNLGVQGGVNLANADIEPELDTKMTTRLMGGAVLEIGFSEMFSVQPELMYVQKGASYSDMMTVPGFGDVSFDATFMTDYIEIPVLFKATFGTSDFKPFVVAGPYIGLMMSSDLEVSALGQTVTQSIKDQTESMDFGLDFGAGGELKVGMTTLFISARYSLGLTDTVKDPDAKAKSNGIQIMVGAMWEL